jgi:hypothetical protein
MVHKRRVPEPVFPSLLHYARGSRQYRWCEEMAETGVLVDPFDDLPESSDGDEQRWFHGYIRSLDTLLSRIEADGWVVERYDESMHDGCAYAASDHVHVHRAPLAIPL